MARLLVVGSPGRHSRLLHSLTLRNHVTILDVSAPASGPVSDTIRVPDMHPETLTAAVTLTRVRTFHGVICWDPMAALGANRLAYELGLPPMWHPAKANLANKTELYKSWRQNRIFCPASSSFRPENFVQAEAITIGRPIEYVAEVAVARGATRLACLFSKRHAQTYRESGNYSIAPADEASEEWRAEATQAACEAVRAAGVENGLVQLVFSALSRHFIFYDLRFSPSGEPVLPLIEEARGIYISNLLAELAMGNRTQAWKMLDDAPQRRSSYPAIVNIRVTRDYDGRLFRGLDMGNTPFPAIKAEPILGNGEIISIPEGMDSVSVATVLLDAPDSETRNRWLEHWLSRRCIRTGSARDRWSAITPSDISTILVDRVDQLDAFGWHNIAANEPFSLSPGWLAVSERLPETREFVAVLAKDDNGLVGGLPCWICARSPSRYDPIQAAGLDGIAVMPIVLAGSRAGYLSRVLLRPGMPGDMRYAVMSKLVEGVRQVARRAGAAEAWLMYADSQTAKDLSDITQTPPLLLLPDTEIVLGTRSHADWLAVLPRKRRQGLTNEVRRWDNDPVDFAVVPLGEVVEEAAPLLAAHNRRFGSPVPDAAMRSYLGLQSEVMGGAAIAFTCRSAGKLVAFSHALEWGNRLVVRVYGELGGIARDDQLYFYLVVHQPLRFAAMRALHAVVLGPSTYRAKELHGATPLFRWAVPLATRHALGDAQRDRNRSYIRGELNDASWWLPTGPA